MNPFADFILCSATPLEAVESTTDHHGMSAFAFHRPFDVLVSEAQASARRFAYRLTRNREDAEDLLQDALVQAYRAFEQYSHGSSFQAWLNRIVLNLFYKRAPRLGRDRKSLELKEAILVDDERPEPLDSVVAERLSLAIAQAIDHLPGEFRDACSRAFLLGQSYDVIAAETGIPVGTVRSRIFRGRRALRETLVREGWVESRFLEDAA